MESKPRFITELIERCRANDRKAQIALYEKYCDGMFIVACRYMPNPADAEDALQDAFIKAFQKIEQFRGEVSFGAWLKRIVINRCLDLLKASKLEVVGLDEQVPEEQAADDGWQVADGLQATDVCKEIEALPAAYQHVLQLYLVEGYDHQEIGEILGISQTNCRTRLMRGRKLLKERLSKHYVTRS